MPIVARVVVGAPWTWLTPGCPTLARAVGAWAAFLPAASVSACFVRLAWVAAYYRGSHRTKPPSPVARPTARRHPEERAESDTGADAMTRGARLLRGQIVQSVARRPRGDGGRRRRTCFATPVTVQYPDRTAVPVADSLPERYRGFLEVDLDICTAARRASATAPSTASSSTSRRSDDVRAMTRFDIDMGKCMYCGICVESCPIPTQAPRRRRGDEVHPHHPRVRGRDRRLLPLTFRFIRPGDDVMPFKPKGEVEPTRGAGQDRARGPGRAREFNALAARWALDSTATGASWRPRCRAHQADRDVAARRGARGAGPGGGGRSARLEALLCDQALSETDAAAMGFSDCRALAAALRAGGVADLDRERALDLLALRDASLVLACIEGDTAEQARPARSSGSCAGPPRLDRSEARSMTPSQLILHVFATGGPPAPRPPSASSASPRPGA